MPAMLLVMFLTFFCTGRADIGTQLARGVGMIALKLHQSRGCLTHSAAFEVELNTHNHHINMILSQAGGRTLITGLRAFHAGVYT
jgi:hypothetical protein